jgi:ankyrin repeat protein
VAERTDVGAASRVLLSSVHLVLAKRIAMSDTSLPLSFEALEYPEARDSDLDSDYGLSDDSVQSENNDRASCHGQSIPSENLSNLSLLETESDLLCSRSHTTSHPAYTELRENRIRLLKILPIQADRTIRCRLEEVSLDDEPTYTAISYTWGSQHGCHTLIVNDHSLLVPKNLWRFLNSARAVDGDLLGWLWIDMLSINQADIPERGHQVSLMPVIFGTASLVNVWLGPAYHGSDAALIALSRNSNHWKSLSQRRKVWASHVGSGIRELCQRPYWKRLWVFQELRLAPQIQLMCGTKTIAWDQFRLFLSLAETDLSAKRPRLSGLVQDSVDSPAMRMVKLNSETAPTHLWGLIQATQHLRCADIRDKAYALLGASTEGHESIKPDYDLPVPTLINHILLEIYKLYPPESLDEALARCDEVEDVLAVPRGTVFTIRGQRGNYEVPSEADFRACRLGDQETGLNLWWTAFYGHVAVQRILLDTWQAEYFASDPSVGRSRLTWKATSVARNLFRTCAMETLSLDPRLSRYSSSFQSRYDAVEGALVRGGSSFKPHRRGSTHQPPLERYFDSLLRRTNSDVVAQCFKILLAPGGFLASEDDRVVDLLSAYAVYYGDVQLLIGLHEAGFVDHMTEGRFFRSAIPGHGPLGFHGIDAERGDEDVVCLPLLSYLASASPRPACISYLLRHPLCDMTIQDENGWTPLIWAARYHNRDFISLVLIFDEPICDVNYSDPNGWTAFEHAVALSDSDSDTDIMSRILSAKTFDHNAVDANGRTRLLRAIENGDVLLAEMLLQKEGCDPNIPDNKGRTPLTLAISAVSEWQAARHSEDATTVSRMQPIFTRHMPRFAQTRLVSSLLHLRHTDINSQDSSGRSALMIASALGSVSVVKLLLSSRCKAPFRPNNVCDPDLVSHNGDTAHSLALSSGHMRIVRLLEGG